MKQTDKKSKKKENKTKIEPLQYDETGTVKIKHKGYNFIEKAGIINKIKEMLNPEKTFLINMELNNGMHDTFMISTSTKEFEYLKNTYVIDPEMKYFNIRSKSYMLDYHQSVCLPIKRTIPANDITNAVRSSGSIDCETALNPKVLKDFVESKIAEGVMKGQQIDDFFKQIKLIMIIGTISSVLMLLLFVFKTGMLSKVSIPGM